MPVHAKAPHIPQVGVRRMEKPNIVETYHIGNATVHIADNFIRTDREEVERILDRIHEVGWKIILECRERGEEV